jgi:hypothetical protein
MTVLTDILEWSTDRPVWQRDALRRIITQRSLNEGDIGDLCKICLAQHGIADPENPASTPNPLAREHLPLDREPVNRVQLIGLRNIQGVNALAADQQMGFILDGLTIVFGYNGSGKSGYARILRSLCHARHRDNHILQDVFADGDQPTPSATVDYNAAGSDRSETWQEGQNPPIELGQVSFFDADCAAVHVNEVNELAFTPFGLDVLPKLAKVCGQISESIAMLVREQERNVPTSLVNPQAADGTKVRTMLNNLDKDSDIETFRRLAGLSQTELQRIVELSEALGADPAARARELRNTVTRLRRLLSNIQRATDALSAEVVAEIQCKLQDVITKKTAARAAAERAFGEQPLSGVGEEVWQELWEAARNYSQQKAYPDQEFPFTEEDARCVLCQQPLTPDAQGRLVAFETFIKAETQQAAEQAEAELSQALGGIQNLTVGHKAFLEFLPDLTEDQNTLKQSIRRFHGIAWKIQQVVLNSCKDSLWTAPYALPTSPSAELNEVIRTMSCRADGLEQAASGDERQTLTNEQNELLARQWLVGILEDVEAEIVRKQMLDALDNANSDTVTTGITRKSSELADTYVTDVLRDRLTAEIETLGAEYLRVEFDSPGGRLGQKRFKISLQGAPVNTEVRHVLSEGEFRCIALAGFLAELSTEQSGSALIFDDPVCSLDHQWRRKVASRLVQLASERQVIVFTHDIVFLTNLVGYCTAQGTQLRQSYLYRGPNQSGECIDGVPWAAMKVSRRIGRLKSWLQTAETMYRRQESDAYEPEARRIYERLRETWERAVEEVLLNGVVIRFEHAIHTQQLNGLADITDGDIQTIGEGMTKSSRFVHDEAGAVADPVPNPDELRQDINNLETWVTQVHHRRC